MNWIIEIAAVTGMIYGLQRMSAYRGKSDEHSRHEKRGALGLVLLLFMIPLYDVLNNVALSTLAMGFIVGFAILLGAVGYHWLTAQRTWTHGLTRSFVIGCFVLAWIVALVVPVAGDYELTHAMPVASTIRAYLTLATLIAPFIALFLMFVLGRIG